VAIPLSSFFVVLPFVLQVEALPVISLHGGGGVKVETNKGDRKNLVFFKDSFSMPNLLPGWWRLQ
jgi:hypothetical protein